MTRRLSPAHARLGMAIASLVGLFASAYLFYTYVSGVPITCGLVSGCETVRASKWAWTLGIPRPFLGLVFYVAVFAFLVARAASAWWPRLLYRLMMIAIAIGFLESAFLFFIQWLDIRAFCLWCLLSACTAIALTILAPFDRAEERHAASSFREMKRYFICLLVFVPIAFGGFVWLIRR